MADHQPDEPEATDTESVEKTPTASTDEKRVPLSELVRQRQAAAEAKRLAEEQAERIKELEERLAAVSASPKQPDGTETRTPEREQAQPGDDPTRSKIEEILRKDAIRDLRDEHGLTSKQAERVHAIMEKMPDLNYEEAYAIAASRHIDVFTDAEGQATGFDPRMHGTTRPRPQDQSAVSEEPDMAKRLAAIKKLRSADKQASNRLWNNLIGSIAAQQIGLVGHKRLDIPQD